MIILSKSIHSKVCFSLLLFFFAFGVYGQHSIGIESRVNRFDVYAGPKYAYTFAFKGNLSGGIYTGLRNGPFSATIHPAFSINYSQDLWTIGKALNTHIGVSSFSSQLKVGNSKNRVYTTDASLYLGISYGKKYQLGFDIGFGLGKEYYSLGSYAYRNFLGSLTFCYVL